MALLGKIRDSILFFMNEYTHGPAKKLVAEKTKAAHSLTQIVYDLNQNHNVVFFWYPVL